MDSYPVSPTGCQPSMGVDYYVDDSKIFHSKMADKGAVPLPLGVNSDLRQEIQGDASEGLILHEDAAVAARQDEQLPSAPQAATSPHQLAEVPKAVGASCSIRDASVSESDLPDIPHVHHPSVLHPPPYALLQPSYPPSSYATKDQNSQPSSATNIESLPPPSYSRLPTALPLPHRPHASESLFNPESSIETDQAYPQYLNGYGSYDVAKYFPRGLAISSEYAPVQSRNTTLLVREELQQEAVRERARQFPSTRHVRTQHESVQGASQRRGTDYYLTHETPTTVSTSSHQVWRMPHRPAVASVNGAHPPCAEEIVPSPSNLDPDRYAMADPRHGYWDTSEPRPKLSESRGGLQEASPSQVGLHLPVQSSGVDAEVENHLMKEKTATDAEKITRQNDGIATNKTPLKISGYEVYIFGLLYGNQRTHSADPGTIPDSKMRTSSKQTSKHCMTVAVRHLCPFCRRSFSDRMWVWTPPSFLLPPRFKKWVLFLPRHRLRHRPPWQNSTKTPLSPKRSSEKRSSILSARIFVGETQQLNT